MGKRTWRSSSVPDTVELRSGTFGSWKRPEDAPGDVPGWVAEYGEVQGIGSTRAAALRDLADRLDVTEAINASGGG